VVSNINRFSLAEFKQLLSDHRKLCAEQGVASTVIATIQDGELAAFHIDFRTEWVSGDSGAMLVEPEG